MESKKLLNTIFLLAIMFSSVLLFAACTGEEAVNPTEPSETGGETAPEDATYPEFIIEVTLDDGGRIYKTMPNYTFIPDEAIGVWKFVDIVQVIDDFDPDVQVFTDYIGWHTNIFFDDGKMLMWTANFQKPITTETWTKGYILLNQIFDRHIMPYTIKQINGDDFLFVEDEPLYQNVDQPPNYCVFRRTSKKPELVFYGYEDVRNADLSLADFSNTRMIYSFTFNEKTIFPPRDKMPNDDDCQPEYILEAGKNPGLGVRALHERGITGKGVNVAIIDQPLYLNHPEYVGKIIEYKNFDCESESSMHGPLVTSLLVGETTGTAPGAKVYYAAAPSWRGDATYYADALDWIVETNNNLPDAKKIRIISISASTTPSDPRFENGERYLESVKKAQEAGILVLDCSPEFGIIGSAEHGFNREDVTLCTRIDLSKEYPFEVNERDLLAPMSPKTTAEQYEKEDFSYAYYSSGGISSAIPYAAGVLAMGWQIRPELTADEMLQILIDTAYIGKDGDKFIYPTAFIEYLQKGSEG